MKRQTTTTIPKDINIENTTPASICCFAFHKTICICVENFKTIHICKRPQLFGKLIVYVCNDFLNDSI